MLILAVNPTSSLTAAYVFLMVVFLILLHRRLARSARLVSQVFKLPFLIIAKETILVIRVLLACGRRVSHSIKYTSDDR